jgi:uncharacterized membrane protein
MLHLPGCMVKVQALYAVFGLLYLVAEISLLAVLFFRRQYRLFPVFTISIAFNFIDNLLSGILLATVSGSVAHAVPYALLPLEYLIDLAVLLEIAWNVLRPVHTSLPRGSMRGFAVAVVLALLVGILLAAHFGNTGNQIQDIKIPFDLTVGLLRMLIFAAIAGFAQLLGIGWRNKVLQLATGLSFYSAVELIVSLIGRYYGDSTSLEAVGVVATTFELGFFVWVFATKDAARREFSPQMEQFLVTLAGRAKLARTALVRMQVK